MRKVMKGQAVVTGMVSEEDLKLINRFTRRKFTAEELYVFQVILCDNEIDRDGEAFSPGSLHKLAGLFDGRTGIFDHNPRGEHQTARLYKTWVEDDPEKRTRYGAPYASLYGKAYMVRCSKNADLILEIDGGIKKEVSVGCSVAKTLCSICGEDWKGAGCSHQAGKDYGGKPCFGFLEEPTDAYEWSFVAVPAQPAAGVVKNYAYRGGMDLKQAVEEVVKGLDPEQKHEFKAYLSELESQAEAGRAYLEKMKKEVLSLSCLAGVKIDGETMQSVVGKLDLRELEAFHKAFAAQLDGPGTVQLAPLSGEANSGADSAFKI